jgi:uncharacterized protein YoxC
MSAGDIAGLIAAIAFVLLVGVMAVPLLKLGRTFDETTRTIRRLADDTHPLLTEVTTTVSHTNDQLVKVDEITTQATSVATNVSALTSLFAATLGSPVVKVAAFTFGVRQAMQGRKTRGRRGRRAA